VPRIIKVNYLAFMDDLALLALTTAQMVILFRIAESFLTAHGIALNATKTVLARKLATPEPAPHIAGEPIGCVLDNGEAFRFLGVEVSLRPGQRGRKDALAQILRDVKVILKDKVLTDKIVKYLYTAVVLPKVTYKASGLCLDPTEIEQMERILRSLIKTKSGLPRSIANAIIHAPEGYGVCRVAEAMDMAVELRCMALITNHNLMDSALVTRIHAAGMRAMVYTGNEPERARQRLACHIDGMVTDAVDRFSPCSDTA
jgi:hypothetical protein